MAISLTYDEGLKDERNNRWATTVNLTSSLIFLDVDEIYIQFIFSAYILNDELIVIETIYI